MGQTLSASIDGAHLEIVCSAPASHPGAFAAVTTVSHPVQALTWGRPLRVPLVQADVVVTLHVLRAESAEDATNGVADPIADIYLPVAELAPRLAKGGPALELSMGFAPTLSDDADEADYRDAFHLSKEAPPEVKLQLRVPTDNADVGGTEERSDGDLESQIASMAQALEDASRRNKEAAQAFANHQAGIEVRLAHAVRGLEAAQLALHQETEARLAAEVRAADTLAEATAVKETVFTLSEQVKIAEAAREDADARTKAIELELDQTSTARGSAEALAVRLEDELADCQASLAASRAETQSALATVDRLRSQLIMANEAKGEDDPLIG
jgi:hypothetical protein